MLVYLLIDENADLYKNRYRIFEDRDDWAAAAKAAGWLPSPRVVAAGHAVSYRDGSVNLTMMVVEVAPKAQGGAG